MYLDTPQKPSTTAAVVFGVLDPIPFGFFVGALIFDAIYDKSADVMWFKSAAWLIAIGLLFAVVPRLINLVQVWFRSTQQNMRREKVAFMIHLLGIAAAIVNAFVHSRDAYGVMPEGLWLSAMTVTLLVVSNILITLQHSSDYDRTQA